ncbi:MAG TPA: NHLP leader peptide family RiPP precursor [Rubrobacter sp.]|nr:NHLP leader peptide family RiPP precursor [Rubrobacter sp.]
MSEAPASDARRGEAERNLVQRSLQDEAFRQKLLDDPRGAVEQELATQLPESVEVRVVEESTDTIYLVLPSAAPIGEVGEITDEELELVAGGVPGHNVWSGTMDSCMMGNPC